jgi:hypothetical protein
VRQNQSQSQKRYPRDIKVLIDNLNRWVDNLLLHYDCIESNHNTVIHDAILGSHKFTSFEMSSLDTPVIQRLS